ncbi:phage tail spike protein [Paenibacillus sp. M2]|uniref:phage tail spike protein n=1 Tax=Paenibacillus sp. M2 TaxID=3341793 RepID=UPI003988A8E0
MITILNSLRQPLAVLEEYTNDEISEQINGSYTFRFSVYMDDEKSQYIAIGNLVEVENQYFNIVKHRRTRSSSGEVIIAVECEQVSYDLLFHVFEDGFIHTSPPSVLMNMALSGTGFSVGTVEISSFVSVELKENATARSILFEIAVAAGGELRFDKYTVSLLARRGQDRGVQFRLGKNLQGIVKDVNGQSGEVLTAYEIDVVELNTLPEFERLEYFELGDTVDIIDEELQINEQQRIIEYAYSPRQRINSKVVIANYIEGIQDTIYRIQTTTVGKDKWMYGVKIGPDEGIVIERYDKLAKSKFNADEFRMQKGDGNGGYTDSLYFDAINQEYTFTGIVRAGQFIGGSIKIGDASNTYFEVTEDGKFLAIDGEFEGKIIGSEFIGGTITGSLIRTSAAGPRIEQSSVLGFRTYDGNSVNRIRITTSSNNDVAAMVYYDSIGRYAGEINSYSDAGLTIFSENLFLGSNNSASPIRFQGAAYFLGNVGIGDIPDIEQAIKDLRMQVGM